MSRVAWLVMGGAGAWSGALLLGPLVRPDLDLIAAHPEDYAQGSSAALTRLGYGGTAIAGLGAALIARRRPIAAALLGLFGVGALAIGIAPPTSGEALGGRTADTLFRFLQLAPLAFFPAITWITWRDRRRSLVPLAVIAWLLFLPLLGRPPGAGILNRAADLAMAAWLAAYAAARGEVRPSRAAISRPAERGR